MFYQYIKKYWQYAVVGLVLSAGVGIYVSHQSQQPTPASDADALTSLDWQFQTRDGSIVIEEMLRRSDLVILRVNSPTSESETNVDAGRGIIQAASDMGAVLKQRYFVLLDGREKPDGYYVTVFYTNNNQLDPGTVYPEYFSAVAQSQWIKYGYNDVLLIMDKLGN